MYKIKLFFFFIFSSFFAKAQELNATVSVKSNQIGNNVSPNTFRTLQTAIFNFLNTKKWTNDTYLPNEKIQCNFIINLQPSDEINVYKANIIIQAARPIFNSSYLAPIINYKDENFTFKYIEFQQLDFNENRVTGSDAQASNLTAILAYYAYLVLAFDYESFSQGGGNIYFQKAQNIINNAPDGRGISGWKAFDSPRNRYWLVENMLNSRYAILHDIYYNYYHSGLDKFYENETTARTEILNVLNQLNNFATDNPNTMISQFYFQGKSTELIKIFSKAPPQDKARASELLQRLDLTNASKYKDALK